MKRLEMFSACALLCSVSLLAQVKPAETRFPSVNGAHQQPIMLKMIRGVIVDANGAVIPDAQVELQRLEGGKVEIATTTMTDYAGRFSLGTKLGRYQVVVRAKGFRKEIVPIEVSAKGWPGFTLKLTPGKNVNTVEVPAPTPQ